MWMLDNTYETLVRYRTKEVKGRVVGTAGIQPHLAESVETSPDGKTFTFKLRRGVKFHSGDEMTAEAVRYSVNRMLTIGLGPSRLIREFIDPPSTPESGWRSSATSRRSSSRMHQAPGSIPPCSSTPNANG